MAALVLPQNLQEVLANSDKVKHSQRVEIFDSVRVHKDGHALTLEVVMSPVKDEAANVIGVSTIARDMTARKIAEEALRQSEGRFRTLVEGAHEFAIFMLNADNTILTWNSGAEQITGYSEAEAIGQSAEIIFTPEDRAAGAPQQEMQTAKQEGRALDERWHLRKSGERFWASGALMEACDESGDQCNFIKIFRDATEQKRAQQELKASEARFRTLSDAVPQIIWTNTAQGEANYFNYRWYDYSGLSYEESYGLGWQAIVHPDDAPASIEQWQSVLTRGEVFDTEYRLRGADGTYRWYIGRNVPLRNEEGEVIAWFGTATDIEELKQAQAELKESHDLLEERVQERTQQLKRTNEAREQLMERIVNVQEEERHRISRELHDVLGQELTALLMGLQVLPKQISPEQGLREPSTSEPSATTAAVTGAELPSYPEQVNKLRASVKNLIERVQRLAWEMRPAELDTLSLQMALKQYVEEWSAQYGIRASFVQNMVIGSERLPEAVETTLFRVVQEALTNVQRHARAKQVSVILEKVPSTVTAIVEDIGQGFETQQDELGEEHPVVQRLGLLGMQERLELIGGTLTIESEPGKGTTVYARVPLSKV